MDPLSSLRLLYALSRPVTTTCIPIFHEVYIPMFDLLLLHPHLGPLCLQSIPHRTRSHTPSTNVIRRRLFLRRIITLLDRIRRVLIDALPSQRSLLSDLFVDSSSYWILLLHDGQRRRPRVHPFIPSTFRILLRPS